MCSAELTNTTLLQYKKLLQLVFKFGITTILLFYSAAGKKIAIWIQERFEPVKQVKLDTFLATSRVTVGIVLAPDGVKTSTQEPTAFAQGPHLMLLLATWQSELVFLFRAAKEHKVLNGLC